MVGSDQLKRREAARECGQMTRQTPKIDVLSAMRFHQGFMTLFRHGFTLAAPKTRVRTDCAAQAWPHDSACRPQSPLVPTISPATRSVALLGVLGALVAMPLTMTC